MRLLRVSIMGPVLLVALSMPAESAEPKTRFGSDGLKLRLEQVGPAPLPNQAVRLRLTLRQESTAEVIDIARIESAASTYLWLKAPKKEYRRIYSPFEVVGAELPIEEMRLPAWTNVVRLTLSEENSVTFAIAAGLHDNQQEQRKTQILFQASGDYDVKILYPISYPVEYPIEADSRKFSEGYDAAKFIAAIANVTVSEPSGDDKNIREMLRDNHDLACAMSSTVHEPDDDLVPLLKQLVERYPDSSYADYARFALARKILKGTGYHWFGEGYTRERYMRTYELMLYESKRSDDELYQILDNNPFVLGKLSAVEARVARDAIAARNRPEEERYEALADFVDLVYISEVERRQAIRWLVQILGSDFPYRPNVLVTLRLALGDMDPTWKARIDREMNERFYDSMPWIVIQREEIGTPREWHDFRVRLRKP